MESDEIKTVRQFHEAISRHDVEGMCTMMHENHTFIDSGGRTEKGIARMREGWIEYFKMFPDYRHEISEFLQNRDTVVTVGKASMTFNGRRGLVPENRIAMPAAWRAIIKKSKILEWQVYADWSEGRKIIQEDEGANE